MKRFAIVLLLLLGACAARPAKDAATGAAPAARVRVASVVRAHVEDSVELTGRVAPPPGQDALVGALAAGRLVAVTARVGAEVKRGDVLARLDPAPMQRSLDAARADEARASSELQFRRTVAERTRSLVDRGVAARQDAEADEAAVRSAEADLARARTATSQAQRERAGADVTAPFDGVVVAVLRHEGEDVDREPVVELAADASLEIVAAADAATLAAIALAKEAIVTCGGAEIPARVEGVAHAVDPATGMGEARFAPASHACLVIGAPARVRVVTASRDALTVPLRAVRRGSTGQDECVAVVDGKAAVRAVKAIPHGDVAEIAEGLAEGERVVTDDPTGLEDGPLEILP